MRKLRRRKRLLIKDDLVGINFASVSSEQLRRGCGNKRSSSNAKRAIIG